MKPRFVIFLLVAFAVILLIAFWLRPVKQTIRLEAAPVAAQPNAPAATLNVASQTTSSIPSVTQQTVPINTAPSGVSDTSIMATTRKFVESKNQPIDFYGQVVDQDSHVLSGVNIKSAVRHWTVANPADFEMGLGSTEIPIKHTTGADGRFEIHGVSGDGFGVVITKDGYDAEPGSRGFGGGTSGSYDNPVIFKMWSTNIHEQLIIGNKSFVIVPDGRNYFIDLTTDTIHESGGGDLKVWIQYTNQVIQGQLYDWSAGIEVINGGLLEVPQTVINSGFLEAPPFAMYSAPTGGYIPSFSLKKQIKGGQSGEMGNRFFYLRLKDGNEYGRMSINLFAPYGYLHPSLIRLSYAINPSGSRILR